MRKLKNWVYSTQIIHHIGWNFEHKVTETKTILFGLVIKRKLVTLMF